MLNQQMMQNLFGQNANIGQMPWRGNPQLQQSHINQPMFGAQQPSQPMPQQPLPPAPMMPHGMSLPPPPQSAGMTPGVTAQTNPALSYGAVPQTSTPSSMMQGATPGATPATPLATSISAQPINMAR